MDGVSEIASPSKRSLHRAGDRGVTTWFPQPQQHRWRTVAYSIDTYKTPGSSTCGANETNSGVILVSLIVALVSGEEV